MRRYLRTLGPVRAILGVASLCFMVGTIVLGSVSKADQLSSVIGGVLVAAALLGFQPQRDYKSLIEAAPYIADNSASIWTREVQNQRLGQSLLLPFNFEILSGHFSPASGAVSYLTTQRGSPQTFGDLKAALSAVVLRDGLRRAVFHGRGGDGKSTLALIITMALLDDVDQNLVPLPLSLESWDPRAESVHRWLDRELANRYPAIRNLRPVGSEGWAGTIARSSRFVLLLDGVDELPRGTLSRAVDQINDLIPADSPLLVFSRSERSTVLFGLRNAVQVKICPQSAETINQYLNHFAGLNATFAGQYDLLTGHLTANPRGPVSQLLTSPLFASLAVNALNTGSTTARQIIERTNRSASAGSSLLIGNYIDAALGAKTEWRRSKELQYISFIARQMSSHGSNSLSWWRTAYVPPSALITIAGTLSVIPGYALALVMPVGLTRGLTIGTTTAVLAGVTRGIPVRRVDVVSVLLTALASVLLVGTLHTPHTGVTSQTVVDAGEISTAVVLFYIFRDTLLFRSVLAVVLRLLFCGVAGSAVTLGLRYLLHFKDPERGPFSLFVGILFGVGISSMNTRLLVPTLDGLQPSQIKFRAERRLGGWFGPIRAGLLSTVAIGIGGGVGGGLRHGFDYGVSLTLLFGIIVGIPAGLVAGAVKWLSAPFAGMSTTTAKSTLRNDRIAALGCIMGVATAASLGVLILRGPLHQILDVLAENSNFSPRPEHGILFGFTIGLVAACYFTAWPAYFVAHMWLAAHGNLPILFSRFLAQCHKNRILRQEGPIYQFRHKAIQDYLTTLPPG